MYIEIKHLLNGKVIFAINQKNNTFKKTVEAAVKIGVSLAYANLGDIDLRGADLSGADLRKANFTNSYLKAVKFIGADLRGSDFSWSDLTNVDFTGANLKNAIGVPKYAN